MILWDGNIKIPKSLLPEREKLKKIVLELQLWEAGKELDQWVTFVMLPDEFMSKEQQLLYRKLSVEQEKFYLEYIGDEYIAELCEEFGLLGKIEAKWWLPELSFVDPYKLYAD